MEDVIRGEKNPMVALLLNCCFGFFGIGYFYIGQMQKAIVMIVLSLIGVGFVVWIVAIFDAYMQAKILQDGGAIGQWTFFTSPSKAPPQQAYYPPPTPPKA